MRLGTSAIPAGATLPDIVDAVGSPSGVLSTSRGLLTDAARAYQDYLNTRAQIETARLQAKSNEAYLKQQYKMGGRSPSYYGASPMKASTRTTLIVGAGVLALIAVGYVLLDKRKGRR